MQCEPLKELWLKTQKSLSIKNFEHFLSPSCLTFCLLLADACFPPWGLVASSSLNRHPLFFTMALLKFCAKFISMRDFLLLLLLSSSLAWSADESSKATPSEKSEKEKNWLQETLKDQQQMRESRQATMDEKKNPYESLSNTKEEGRPVSLLDRKEKAPAPKTLPTKSSETSLRADPRTPSTYRPAISGFSKFSSAPLHDSPDRKESNPPRSSDLANDPSNSALDPQNPFQIRKPQELSNQLNTRRDNLKLENAVNVPPPTQNLDPNNPYTRNPLDPKERQNSGNFNSDRFTSVNITPSTLPNQHSINSPSAPKPPVNPSLNFRPANQDPMNRNPLWNQNGVNKSRIPDPNDYLRR